MSPNLKERNKILLIGWDAADWKVIDPLLDAGKMPALESLINAGVAGNLATIRPVLSPMLWTSIATGKRADKHGIHGFTEPTPDGSGIRPITNLSRKAKAFWNIFNQNGLRGHVVGWWPSSPAEPIHGVMVSNHFQQMKSPDPHAPWPMPAGAVHPPELAEELAAMRFHPGELVERQVRPFIPHADEVDQDNDSRLGVCMKMIAECTSIQSVATHLLETEPWDYAAVYFDAIDHFCHGFMKYHPPRQKFVSEQDFRLYSHVVEAGYRYHDMMLARLLQLAGPDATVILISDHGFHPDHMRLPHMTPEPAAPAAEHRDLGIFVMRGRGIRCDERIYGASLLDICPTLLVAAGLPVGSDMDGKPLVQAWQNPPQVEQIASWETVPGETGQHPPGVALDSRESQQAIQQLVDLGYIDQPPEDCQRAIASTVRELDYNLAQSYMDADRHADAVDILEKHFANDPTDTRIGMRLIFCYRALERIDKMKPVLELVKKHRIAKARESAAKFNQLLEEFCRRPKTSCPESAASTTPAAENYDPQALVAFRAAAAKLAALEDNSQADEDERNIARQTLAQCRNVLLQTALMRAHAAERRQLHLLAREARHNPYSFDYLDGYVQLAEGKVEPAIACFLRAEKAEPRRPWLPIQLGEAYQQLNRFEESERSFRRAIELDPDNPFAHAGLARTLLGMSRDREAAEAALAAVAIQHHFPYAHYLLATALHHLGQVARAIEALRTAVSLNPNFAEAHIRLAALYEHRQGDAEKGVEHRQAARQAAANNAADILPKSTFSDAASTFERQRRRHEIGHAIPNRPALRPGLDLSKVITIVTGLPRSGTSMLMQMLEAGGLPALTDGRRAPDADNPRGYFELDRVKRLRMDAGWLAEANGKAVKVIAQLLPALPKGCYRVIYVDRDLDEVVQSQRTMLKRNGKNGSDDDQLKDAFAKQIRMIGDMLNAARLPVVKVSHRRCIEQPQAVACELNRFLGGKLDEPAMAAAVDARLYRQRATTP